MMSPSPSTDRPSPASLFSRALSLASRSSSSTTSRGIRKSSPPSTSSLASTPAMALPPSLRARGSLPEHRVPTLWFRTTSPDFSARDSQACCILLPIVGFIAFPLGAMRTPGFPCSRCREVGGAEYDIDGFPAMPLTLRRSSPIAAVPCHHGRYSSWCSLAFSRDSRASNVAVLTLLTLDPASATFKVLLRSGLCTFEHRIRALDGLSFPGFRSPSRSFDPFSAVKLRSGGCVPARQVQHPGRVALRVRSASFSLRSMVVAALLRVRVSQSMLQTVRS